MQPESDLPTAVLEYFHLMDNTDKAMLIELFTPDAEVADDGRTYRGRAEITGWIFGAASEFTTTSTRLSADCSDHQATVVIRVEGNFPGGRVDLRHDFTLDPAGRISTLSIAPWPQH